MWTLGNPLPLLCPRGLWITPNQRTILSVVKGEMKNLHTTCRTGLHKSNSHHAGSAGEAQVSPWSPNFK